MAWILSAFADEAGGDSDTQVKACREGGLNYIDLRGVDGHNICDLPMNLATEIKKKLDDAGIKVNMFGSPLGKIDLADDFNIDVEKLNHLGSMRDVFGCNQVRIFSYYNKKAGKDQQAWQDESLKRLEALRDQAKTIGLVLFHENEGGIFGDHGSENVIIGEKLRDGETFKLIFDFDNYNRGGDDVWDNWTKLKDMTDAFHLKDSDEKGQHVPIGTGAGQATKILADAKASGFNGPLSLEPHLRHSKAVMATHASGRENQSFKDLSEFECFQVAVKAAKSLLAEIGVEQA